MSAEEDTELRDLVAQTLESNGVLGKIRAQLRASVFLALEEQESIQNKTPFLNSDLKKFLSSKEGRTVTGLVKEFLQFFNLDFTLAVFESETGLGDSYEGRGHLARDLDIIESAESAKLPLVSEVTRRCTNSPPGGQSSAAGDLTPAQVKEAKKKFEFYDKDKNGVIDKDELRGLFMDMFPAFHKNMLERYVNDEFKAVDKDFSQTIDFDEFVQMYKRLFVLCKSVVSHQVADLTPASPRTPTTPTTPTSKIPFLKKPTPNSNSLVESKNRRNETESSKPLKNSLISPRDMNSPRDGASIASTVSEQDDDSFFDDPLPSGGDRQALSNYVNIATPSSWGVPLSSSPRGSSSVGSLSPRSPLSSPRLSQIPRASEGKKKVPPPTLPKPKVFGSGKQKTPPQSPKPSGLSSLSGLPSLNNNTEPAEKSPRTPDMDQDIKDIDKKIADLGFEVPDDSYDDDFESSKSVDGSDQEDRDAELDDIDNSKKDAYEGEKHSLTPFGQTPRSARSDANVKSIDEDLEIEEDIDEDLSVADDLLKSDPSGMDDLTTDRTVSPTDQSTAFDYVEDILP